MPRAKFTKAAACILLLNITSYLESGHGFKLTPQKLFILYYNLFVYGSKEHGHMFIVAYTVFLNKFIFVQMHTI